jgi:hypothetical protein
MIADRDGVRNGLLAALARGRHHEPDTVGSGPESVGRFDSR